MELDTACKGGLYKSKESQLTTSDNTTMDYYGLLGYYPSQKGGYKSVANMSVLQEKQQRRKSQPDILDSNDTGFYSSNYSSNYTANYSSNPTVGDNGKHANCKSPTSDKSGWKSSKSYAMVPRMGRRASRDINTKFVRDSSRPANKKDYQDVYKDRKEEKSKANKKSSEPKRMISMDTGAIITGMPTVPTRLYSREDDYAAYEELIVEDAPPKLAPVSGLLSQTAGKAVVRPIAFKPVVSSKQNNTSTSYCNNPQSPETYGSYEKPHIDDGYASQDSRSCSHNGTMRDSFIYDTRPASYDSNGYRDQKPVDCYQVTPSPTDNVGHYEQLLQEKERELVVLRESMEANEKAIFQVNEEKRLNWENQMKDLTTEYHRRLRLQQDRAYKAEQELQDEIKKISLENQQMNAERDQLQSQKSHNSHLLEQIKQLRAKNDDLSNRLTKVSCDCEVSRKNEQDKQACIQNLEELVTVIKAENMNLTNELDEKRRTIKKLERGQEKANPNSDNEIQRLEQLLAERDMELRQEREHHLHDRDMWEQEKKKVLQYQRQLQSNYIQMCRRNSDLESSKSPPTSHPSPTRPHNNNDPSTAGAASDKQSNLFYPSRPAQDKASFRAQLESTPESLC